MTPRFDHTGTVAGVRGPQPIVIGCNSGGVSGAGSLLLLSERCWKLAGDASEGFASTCGFERSRCEGL